MFSLVVSHGVEDTLNFCNLGYATSVLTINGEGLASSKRFQVTSINEPGTLKYRKRIFQKSKSAEQTSKKNRNPHRSRKARLVHLSALIDCLRPNLNCSVLWLHLVVIF